MWKINRSGVYRHLNAAKDGRPRQRPGPHGEMPDAPMTEAIEQVIKDSPFHGEGYRKVHACLPAIKGYSHIAGAGLAAHAWSNGLLAKSCRGPARGTHAHDVTIIPSKVDEMWGTDMTTTTLSTGKFGRRLRGHRPSLGEMRGSARLEALEPIRQGVNERFGSIGKCVAASLRHDNESQSISRAFQDEIRWLGIDSSPSFVR